MTAAPVFETNLPGLNLLARGKVRDIYDLGDHLLIVATDRISAYDVVMPNGIPDKGRILTTISSFWFKALAEVVDNHLITTEVEKFPEDVSTPAMLFLDVEGSELKMRLREETLQAWSRFRSGDYFPRP